MSEPQTSIPKNIFNYWLRKLKPSTSIVLFCLFNMRNDEGFAITTNNEIKNIIGMTKETVIHALNDLKQLGLITKTVASYGYRHRPHKISLCMDVINHLQVEGTAHV